jgi:hypothetical protein
VEDPPAPVEVAGVLMLPVHPALGDNPALGFDKTQVLLVLYQSVQRMAAIEQPSPPPPPVPAVASQSASADRTQTPALNILRIGNLSWRIEVPTDNEWHDTGIPVIAAQRVLIRPTNQQTYTAGEGYWSAGFGEYKFDVPEENEESDREFDQELTEDHYARVSTHDQQTLPAGGYEDRTLWSQSVIPLSRDGIPLKHSGGHNELSVCVVMTAGASATSRPIAASDYCDENQRCTFR